MKKITIWTLTSLIFNINILFSQEEAGIYNIHFNHDFEDNTLGEYQLNEINTDWKYPSIDHSRARLADIVESTDPKQPSKVMRLNFPEGSVCGEVYDGGGVQWFTPLNNSYEEIYFSYRIKFKDDFEPVLSGKLPGVIGGPQWGGRPPYPDEGFVAKYSWSWLPDIAAYIYHHDMTYTHGDSYAIGLGIPDGKWVTLTMRIVMNSVGDHGGNYDGLLETFVNDTLFHQITNLRFREVSGIGTDHIEVVAFFGGLGPEFAATRDEWIEFDDFVAFTYKDGVDVPRGNELSASDRIVISPYEYHITDVPQPEPDPTPEPEPQTPFIAVNAYGSEVAGENAHFNLLVNGEKVGETYVTGLSTEYLFNLSEEIGPYDTITIYYDNNFFDETLGDRNLFIQSVNINGTLYDPSGSNTIFMKEGYDHSVSTGTGDIYFPGWLHIIPGVEEVDLKNFISNLSNNPPVIEKGVLNIGDTLQAGAFIGEIEAYDPDIDHQISYTIVEGNPGSVFSIDPASGKIYLNSAEGLATSDKFELVVEVSDNYVNQKSSTGAITVNVIRGLAPEPVPADPPVAEKVIYIDPSNNNDNARDGSLTHPFSSWKEVTWKPGYEYLQKKGTTAVEGKINILVENVRIGSYGEGDLPVISSNARDYALRAYEKSNITINDMHVIANDAISCIYFMGGSSDNNTVEGCVLEGAGSGVRIIEGNTFTVKYTTIKNTIDGIYSFAAVNKIYYNIFRENQTAINISSYVSTADVFNNVFYGNSSGITTTYAELTLYNNIFYLVNAGDVAINHSMDKLVSDNNIFYPERTGFVNINNQQYASIYEMQSDLNIDLNSFSDDPGFVDIYNDNFKVNEQSPAIDAGKYVGILADFYGQAVPVGNMPDIGLTELTVSKTVTAIPGENKQALIVYPNPSNGNFNIKLENNLNSNYSLKVTDITGRTVFQGNQYPTDYISNIDISGLPKGRYHLHLKSDEKTHIEQIIIQ